jgi:phosphatidylglycerophosphate synthase
VLALLTIIGVVGGIGRAGWVVGGTCAVVATGLLWSSLARTGHRLGPADRITVVRAVLACSVAALVVAGDERGWLVALATLGVLLDGVDGRVARRTGTASAFGARFDMEVDAFLILALSVHVAGVVGPWVLLIGAARYLLLAAAITLPWLRAPLPPRPWCKVVAVVQAVVLIAASAGVLTTWVARSALLVALALLAESFGREVRDLWRLRSAATEVTPDRQSRPRRGATVVTILAAVLVWLALVAPDRLDRLSPGSLVRIPLEGLVLLAVAVLLGHRARRATAVAFGALLGLLVIVKLLDMGFRTVFDRPFDPLSDWYYLGPGIGVLGDSTGRPVAVALAITTGVLAVALVVGCCLAVVRVVRVAAEHRRRSALVGGALAVTWVICSLAGVQVASGATASRSTADLAYYQLHQLRSDLADRRTFAREIGTDAYAGPASDPAGTGLLTALRGKDVLVVFVESYGRVAVEGSSFSPGINRVLDDGTARLHDSGYSMRSAFLTSPTFGAGSWLAHATLQSGLWVDSQQRYNQLVTQRRLTLTRAFGQAGWRTVFDVPANTHPWAEGQRFYGFDQLYDSRNVGYRGPAFGYAPVPDQYTLAAFQRDELTGDPGRSPVMAEIDLVSSHHPWAPSPKLVDWADVGDGSVFAAKDAVGAARDVAFHAPDQVRDLYAKSVEYSMSTLVSWLESQPDRDLVLLVLGDHQPHSYVTGAHAGHDVPATLIARDPAVVHRVSSWGWQPGLRPGPDAPVWRMDAFRDRFLAAFSR